MTGHEEPLDGGNASSSVVRVGGTVRKPWLPTSQRTSTYVRSLLTRGVDLPVPHGRDSQGRLILDYVPGVMAVELVPLDLPLLRRVGELVRQIHDASAGLPVPDDWEVLIPTERPDLLCHHDLAPWNLVVDDTRLVFIDWAGAGPSTRLWDLAYAAVAFGHLFPEAAPETAADRLVAFVDGYGADQTLRAVLPEAMTRRAGAMHELLRVSHDEGREPWASMFVDGHGAFWRDATAYVAEHQEVWTRALSPA